MEGQPADASATCTEDAWLARLMSTYILEDIHTSCHEVAHSILVHSGGTCCPPHITLCFQPSRLGLT
jgi:hypothetical protein